MSTRTQKKKRLLLASMSTLTLGASILLGVSTLSSSAADAFNLKSTSLKNQVTLNSGNKVTSSGDVIQKTEKGNNVTYTYSNVASSTSGHVTLADGGYVVNKTQITSLSAITATFSGSGTLKARLAYVTSTYSDYFTLVSGSRIETGSNPYFIELKAEGGSVTITSAIYEFTCVANPNASPKDTTGKYIITFNASGSDSNTAFADSSDVFKQVTSGSDYISSFSEISKVFAGVSGIKFGSSSSAGSITINFDSSTVIYPITTIDVASLQYGSDNGKFNIYVNDSSSYTQITPSSGGSVTVNDNLTSLTIKTSKRAYLTGLTLNYGGKTEPGKPDNPTAYEVGFTAVDENKDTYTTNSVFDNANCLVVTVNNSDGTSYVTTNYTYIVYNSSDVEIDTSAKFPAAGTYKLVVSYGTYIDQEITLNVGEYIYIVDVAASMTTTTFNTATTLSSNLSGNLAATLEYSDGTTSEAIEYANFASNNLDVKLINPKGITHSIDNPFGAAGTWTLKVYDLDNDEMYYDISLTVNAIPVQSISLNQNTYTLYPAGTLQLTATVGPENATNRAIEWTSDNEEAATVSDEGLVTAVAVGTAEIKASAIDGSGVYGSCVITVVTEPVEPTWEEVTDATSLKEGDVIVIYYDDASKELDGMSNTSTVYGIASDYSNNPTGAYPLTLVAGSNSGSFALKNGSDYLVWESGNSLQTTSAISEKSSWTFSGKGTITNVYDTSRILQYNTNNPRFACYTGTQKTVDLLRQTNAAPVTPVYPTSISLTGTSTISIGETSQLTVEYSPDETNIKNVSFTSSNESVATVSNGGLVTGVTKGSATITATAEAANNTTKKATLTVTVNEIDVTSVSLSSNSETIKIGKTVTLIATISPSSATNKNVTWSSSNTSIATVSDAGVVTGVAAGEATITVSSSNNKTATCVVTVTESSSEETFTITYGDIPTAYQTDSTVYTAASGIKFQAYNCANYSSKVQFKASSGYLQNTESLELQSLTINDRESNTLTVYGSNTAGEFSTEIEGSNDVYDLTGYSYFKVARTSSGAAYCSSLTIITGTPTPINPTNIILSPTSAELAPGGTKSLSVSYVPSNANQNKEITWTSSNTSVATVDSAGKITAKSTATVGQTATITAKLTNIPSITATCTITIVEQSKDDHTVLIYMCGSNLESDYASSDEGLASGDIDEILNVSGQPDDVNIVIETGGANSWSSTYGISSSKLERWHVENRSLVKDGSLSYASMGLTSTLQSFVEYGLKNYPAERTGLIFWNHGGAMRGCCYDEKKNDDSLLTDEVSSAISGALNNCNMSGQKLEWVGYDCCLMQVQDIASINSDYFNYMIASEESEAGYGWDYDTWVDDLYAKKTTPVILKAVVDGFIKDNGGTSSSSNDQTLSYLDLSYMPAYITAWNNMATQLGTKLSSSNKSSFNNLVKSCKYYADSDYTYYGIFDAKDFINKLASNSTFNPGSTYTNAVLSAFSNLVAYSSCGKGAGNSYGLCMFWSVSSNCEKSTYYTSTMTKFTAWRSLVNSYGY